MATARLDSMLRHIRRLATGPSRSAADAELLARYAAQQDQAAFAELMRRHGGLVWGVCQRVLGHDQDSEDAFQATFLALAVQAARRRRVRVVAGWLHGAAETLKHDSPKFHIRSVRYMGRWNRSS